MKVVGIVAAVIAVVAAVLLAPHWFAVRRARRAGVGVDFRSVVGMRLRRVDAKKVVEAAVRLHLAGVGVRVEQLESVCLAGGDLDAITEALIVSQERGSPVSWDTARALSLAGYDVAALARDGRSLEGLLGTSPPWLPGYRSPRSATGRL